MTLTPVGFKGSVNAVLDAKRSQYQGVQVPVVGSSDAMKVTANGAATLTCKIAAGVGWAHGVQVTSDAEGSVSFDPVTVAGQTRWDAVVLRRTWTDDGGTVTFAVVKGTAAASAPQIQPPVNNTVGGVHDQVLALAQITYGSSVPIPVDRRLWSSKVITAPSLAALPAASLALYGTEAALLNGDRYRCLLDSTNNPAWVNPAPSTAAFELTQTGVLLNNVGWSGGGLANHAFVAADGRMVDLDIELRRTGGSINANNTTGKFVAGTVLCTVVGTLQPLHAKLVNAVYYGGTGFDTYPCVIGFSTTGVMTLLSGMPALNVENRSGSDDVSVRVCLSYARKAQS